MLRQKLVLDLSILSSEIARSEDILIVSGNSFEGLSVKSYSLVSHEDADRNGSENLQKILARY